MYETLAALLYRLDNGTLAGTSVIGWGAPVPSFGNLSRARIASVGLNPSNREFLDQNGEELDGGSRRFHTLRSLNLNSWSEASVRHLKQIMGSCEDYFDKNPYDRWFGRLDRVLQGANASFYGHGHVGACHLDLIPYATKEKWTALSTAERTELLKMAGDTLGMLLRGSNVSMLILNGRSVVDNFEVIAGTSLERKERRSWALPRHNGSDVKGVSFSGLVESVGGIALDRNVRVVGYNHNIQSSFGVTNEVVDGIRSWIKEESVIWN